MSEPAQHKGIFSRQLLNRVLFAWVIVALIAMLRDAAAISAMRFSDPDDSLRLTQVRDLIAGQGWFDLHQYRIDPPHGILMHWSRLVDLPIAAAILALRPLVGQPMAELVAAVIVPLITLLIAQLLAGRIAWKLFGAEIAGLVCLTWMLAIPTMNQLNPLRIDHHGWQIVAVLAAVNGLIAHNPRIGGWLAGAALAFGMSISLELLPFTALFAAIFGLRWLADSKHSGWLVHMLQALAISSLGLFLATRGLADLINHCDIVSPAYLAAFASAAVLVSGVAVIKSLPRWALAVLLMAAAVTAVGIALAIAPQCTTGPFAQLDPLVRRFWYSNVLEGRPVWHQIFPTMVQIVVPPLTGLFASALLYRQAEAAQKRFALEFGLLLAGTLAIAVAVTRFGGVACALSTIPVGWLLRRWLDRINLLRNPLGKIAAIAGMLALLVPGLLVLGVQAAMNSVQNTSAAMPAAGNSHKNAATRFACGMPRSLQMLARLPRSTIFAPMDIGPSILLRTPHSVVATGHHRASASMHDVIEAYMADPQAAQAIVLRHHARYLVACTDLTEINNYRTTAKQGLAAQLIAGKSPDWLMPVPLPSSAGTLKLWQIVEPNAIQP